MSAASNCYGIQDNKETEVILPSCPAPCSLIVTSAVYFVFEDWVRTINRISATEILAQKSQLPKSVAAENFTRFNKNLSHHSIQMRSAIL
jgi:hypothetical protein